LKRSILLRFPKLSYAHLCVHIIRHIVCLTPLRNLKRGCLRQFKSVPDTFVNHSATSPKLIEAKYITPFPKLSYAHQLCARPLLQSAHGVPYFSQLGLCL